MWEIKSAAEVLKFNSAMAPLRQRPPAQKGQEEEEEAHMSSSESPLPASWGRHGNLSAWGERHAHSLPGAVEAATARRKTELPCGLNVWPAVGIACMAHLRNRTLGPAPRSSPAFYRPHPHSRFYGRRGFSLECSAVWKLTTAWD